VYLVVEGLVCCVLNLVSDVRGYRSIDTLLRSWNGIGVHHIQNEFGVATIQGR
jgi:hypothetical protein